MAKTAPSAPTGPCLPTATAVSAATSINGGSVRLEPMFLDRQGVGNILPIDLTPELAIAIGVQLQRNGELVQKTRRFKTVRR